VLWAWCPAVLLEASNNAHIDVLAAFLAVVAVGAAASGRQVTAGIALGAGIATKLFPVLLLPGLAAGAPLPGGRAARSPAGPAWRFYLSRVVPLLAATVATLALVYLPHVLAVGSRVLGFLPDYLAEEGYEGGGRFPLLQLALPGGVAAAAGLAILAAVALGVVLRGDPARPWQGSMVLVGLALGLAGVTYPWYLLLLVALVALDGRWEWLALAAAAVPGYFSRALDVPILENQQISYGLAFGVILLVTLTRRRRARELEPVA
jgi:hypothetical protein